MTKVLSQDQLKVPAFQRKRSLAARKRKKIEPRTALERKEAGISPLKKKKAKASTGRTLVNYGRERRASAMTREKDALRDYFSSPIVDDESTYERKSVYSSEDVNESFPSFREMRRCGEIDGYFDKIQVAGIQVSSRISVGDRLVLETEDGLFEQEVTSMQIDREDVPVAYAGDEIGIKVSAEPKKGGKVYRVI